MPSRKLTDRCPRCYCKNHLRALHCNQCSADLDEERATKDSDGRAKLYADIAHPINSDCRELIQSKVLKAYEEEIVRSKETNYVCAYDDYGEDRYATLKNPDEVPEPQPVTATLRVDDVTHRVEPAASQSGPPEPHHALSRPSAQSAVAGNGAAQSAPRTSEDETFGIGLD